jgi:hypothetical protein
LAHDFVPEFERGMVGVAAAPVPSVNDVLGAHGAEVDFGVVEQALDLGRHVIEMLDGFGAL